MARGIIKALDERLRLSEIYEKQLAGYLVAENLSIFYSLGSVLITLFAIQVVTGILLMIYYIPSVDKAFNSVALIASEVRYGWLIRGVHAAAANLFVLVLFLHIVFVLITGSYKKPREVHWMSGFALFGLVLLACLSGYLLPWSQLSYWATTIGTSFPSALPFFGHDLVAFVRGGEKVSQLTLGRFFAAHVTLVPFLIFLLIILHIFVMRRTGISYPPGTDETKVRKYPFFPHFIMEDSALNCFFMAMLFLLVFLAPEFLFPQEARVPANPLETPLHIKPEWYFLANYQMLKIIPNEVLGIMLQVLAGTLLFFLPLIDRNPERRITRRPIFITLVVSGVIGYILLAIWGWLS